MRDAAIRNTHLNVATIINGKQGFDDNGNLIELNEKLIKAEIARLEAEYKATQYQRDRAKEYPSLQEQADMSYWDRKNGTTTLDDAIEAVKLKYPKGDN